MRVEGSATVGGGYHLAPTWPSVSSPTPTAAPARPMAEVVRRLLEVLDAVPHRAERQAWTLGDVDRHLVPPAHAVLAAGDRGHPVRGVRGREVLLAHADGDEHLGQLRLVGPGPVAVLRSDDAWQPAWRPEELDGPGLPVARAVDHGPRLVLGRERAVDRLHVGDEALPARAVGEPLRDRRRLAALDAREQSDCARVGA